MGGRKVENQSDESSIKKIKKISSYTKKIRQFFFSWKLNHLLLERRLKTILDTPRPISFYPPVWKDGIRNAKKKKMVTSRATTVSFTVTLNNFLRVSRIYLSSN